MKPAFIATMLLSSLAAESHAPQWYKSPEWALVFVGIVTCFVVGWQAVATQLAASATRESADALWYGQRAQLVMEPNHNPLEDLVSNTPRIRLEVHNRGQTPAYDCFYEHWIELLPIDAKDFTPEAEHYTHPHANVIFSGSVPLVLNIPFVNGLTPAQKDDIRYARKTGFVRVLMKYRDAKKKSERFIDMGFRIDHDGMTPLGKYHQAN